MWRQQSKKTIENVALGDLFIKRLRLAFLRTANSSALGFTGNQLTEDAWLLDGPPSLTRENWQKIASALKILWAKMSHAIRKYRWKILIAHLGFL